MNRPRTFTTDEARQVGEAIGVDWDRAPFDVEQFRIGMNVELEHGRHDPATDVTGDDPVVTGKIALAHLNEFADYYTRLAGWSPRPRQTRGRPGAVDGICVSAAVGKDGQAVRPTSAGPSAV